jgi:predicted permease
MPLIAQLRSLAAGLLRRKRLEQSMDDEMRFHIDAYTNDLIRSGGSRKDAERRARIQFGGVEAFKEHCRDARGLRILDDLRNDLRYALRTLLKSPSFTITAVLTLALGIGANTGLFTMIDTLLLRPIPVHDPASLYQVSGHLANRVPLESFSVREYQVLAAPNQLFTQTIADSSVRARYRNERIGGYVVSGNYFQALGGRTVLGRPILPEDALPSAPPVVVLGYAAWQRYFNGDSRIVGEPVVLSGNPVTVIGVASAEFTGIDAQIPGLWAPLTAKPLFTGNHSNPSDEADDRSLRIIGRLRPGVAPAQAQSALSALLPRIVESRQPEMRLVDASLESRARYQNWNHADPANVLPILVSFAMILLIACTNLSNVLLARALSREREIGLRLSLGASRGRIVRQLVTETAVLSLIAGAAGLAISHGSWVLIRHVLVSSFSMKTGMPIIEIHPDYRVFLFALLLSLATGIAFGLAPAVHATRSTLNSALKGEGAWPASRFRPSMLREGLVVTQFSLSLVLLIGAGLLLHSTIQFGSVRPGFDVSHTISVEPIQETSGADPTLTMLVAERLRSISSVLAVAPVMREPLRGSLPRTHVTLAALGPRELDANYNEVAPEYFAALDIPIVRGRAFSAAEDAAGAAVAVISEATARRFWPVDDPIGKTLEIATNQYSSGGRELLLGTKRTIEVVGVAKDVVSAWLWDGTDRTCIYLPSNSRNSAYYSLLLRVHGDPRTLLPFLRATLGSVDPSVEFDVRAMTEVMDFQILPFRLASWGAAALALLGLTLASIGVYGVMAYTVSRRTREIGIRMALGADRRQVLWLTVRQGFRLIAISAGCGVVLSLGLSRIMRAMLFRVGANDPWTFVAAPAILALIGLLAIYVPSRKAARIDPNVALRYE